MKRLLAWLVLMLLAFAPLAGQATRDSVVCTACVLDSTITRDSVPVIDTVAWAQTTTISWFKRDSIQKVPVVAASCPNLPAGYRVVTERPFAAKGEDGWSERATSNYQLVSDATAPRSAPGIARAYYPAGYKAGTGPIAVDHAVPKAQGLFTCFWLRLSPGWVGEPSGVNKVLHFWLGGSNRAVISAQGAGAGPFRASIRTQNTWPVGNRNLGGSGQIRPGHWSLVEVELVTNAAGVANGRARWWVDGQLAGDYALGWTQAAGWWERVSWNPTWGGTAGVLGQPQWMDLDHLVVAVR